MELSWNVIASDEITKEAHTDVDRISFTVSFFDSKGFPQDRILYDFAVRNASSGNEVIKRYTNQDVNSLGSASHSFAVDRTLPDALQVEVIIKAAGSLPVLLDDRATFEIAVIPEFPSFLLTIILGFTLGMIMVVTRAKLLYSR